MRDGIEVDFVQNLFYAKAAGRQTQHVNSIEQLFPYAGTNQGFYRGSNGLLVPSVNGVPRIEFDASGNCMGLLEEISRTNLMVRSQELAAAPWFNANLSSIANNTLEVTDPAGGNNATKIVSLAGGAVGNGATLSAAVHTGSVWVRCNTGTVTMDLTIYLAASPFTIIGITPVVITTTWQRVTVVSSTATADLYNLQLNNMSAGTVYAYGAQIEAGAFATSYMPTTTIAVTRGSETFTRTIGSEIIQGQGTFVIEYRTNNNLLSTFATALSMDDGSTNNRLFMFRNNVGTRTGGAVSGGVSQFSSAGGDDGSTFRKCVMVYSTAGYRHFMNGALVGAVGAASVPNVTTLRLGNSAYGADYLNGHIKRFKYYPRVLSDAEAIAETV